MFSLFILDISAPLTSLCPSVSLSLSLSPKPQISICELNQLLMHPFLHLFSPRFFLLSSPALSSVSSTSFIFFYFTPTLLTAAVFFSDACLPGSRRCHARRDVKAPELTAVQKNGRRCGRRIHNNLCTSPSDPGILTTGRNNSTACQKKFYVCSKQIFGSFAQAF